MNIEDVINKLEFILHKKSIKTLEKYTQQVAATAATTTTPPVTTTPPTTTPPVTTPPVTTPPVTTPPVTTPPVTTPPVTTPPVTTPPVTTPTTPPKEEDKKPSEEATKFENNLMDTLKWVFIGIAIFVVIIVILGIVYWFIFGSSTSTTETTDGMNAENMNAENMNGENAANAEVPYNDIQEPYIEASPINDASSSSILSSFIPYSSSFSRNESPEVLAVAVQEPVIEAPDIQVLPTAISATTPEIPTAISTTTPEIPTAISATTPEIPAAPTAIAAVPEPVIVPEPISASSIAVQNNSIEVKK